MSPEWATALLTLLLVGITGFYAWVTHNIQKATAVQAEIQKGALQLQGDALKLQNNLFRGQVLAHRHEMFWRSLEPVTDAEVADVELVPDDYMNPRLYQSKYRSDHTGLRRYLYLSRLYLYLAFTYTLKRLDIDDPMGEEWMQRWVRSLVRHQEFLEADEWLGPYYPEFSDFVKRTRGAEHAT